MSESPDSDGPLADVRVLDLSMFLSGPFACHQLADLGAEIVKVEPSGGDPSRRGSLGARTPPNGHFAALQAGRMSVVLDLKSAAAKEVLLELAGRCDVLVQNFRPGVAARLGADYETIRRANPAIVSARSPGRARRSSGRAPPSTASCRP